VQDKLARFENEPYESDDPKVIHLLLEPVQAGLSSPLTLAQEEDLLVRRSGVSVIVGSRALCLQRVGEALKNLTSGGVFYESVTRIDLTDKDDAKGIFNKVQKLYSRGKPNQDQRVNLVPAGISLQDLFELLEELASWTKKLTADRTIHIDCSIDSSTLFNLYEGNLIGRVKSIPDIGIHYLQRWRRDSLRHWFNEIERPSQENQVDAWIEQTGGWPCLLEKRQQAFVRNAPSEVTAEIMPQPSEFLQQTGLMSGNVLKLYRVLSSYGEAVPREDMKLLLEHPEEFPDRVLDQWLDYLVDIDVVLSDGDKIAVEPVVKAMLERFNADAEEGQD